MSASQLAGLPKPEGPMREGARSGERTRLPGLERTGLVEAVSGACGAAADRFGLDTSGEAVGVGSQGAGVRRKAEGSAAGNECRLRGLHLCDNHLPLC
jgi:hypothetical protein